LFELHANRNPISYTTISMKSISLVQRHYHQILQVEPQLY